MSEEKLLVVFSSKPYDEHFFTPWLDHYKKLGFRVEFLCESLSEKTLRFCQGASAICLFVSDKLSASMIQLLENMGVELVVLRCAGMDNVDLEACEEAGIPVMNVPAYGPHSVAEHALALIMAVNRKLALVHDRVRAGDLSLNMSLLGFEMRVKTVGIVGTGKIGATLAKILHAMECRVLCTDVVQNPAIKDIVTYVPLENLLAESMVVSLHVPLTVETYRMIDSKALSLMPAGSILVNTSRGGLVDTKALIAALKKRHLGGAALDVYEAEGGQFYHNFSDHGIQDDVLARLTTFPNVIITCHQGYFTKEAMEVIAETTFRNVEKYYNQ